jgi:hypothetical protein
MSVSRSALASIAAVRAWCCSAVSPSLAGDEGGNGGRRAGRGRPERAELVVVDHLGEARQARFEAISCVLLEEELGVGEARAHDALVAADHRDWVFGLDVADEQELVGQLAAAIEQREVFLVGLHRQDQAFLRHGEEFLFELADQHVGALDERRDFVEQRVVLDRTGAGLSGRDGKLAGDFGAAFGEAGDDRAFILSCCA